MSVRRRLMMTVRRMAYNASARADAERYRRYHEAKRKIPMDLPPREYEERVKKLARKYKI